MKKIFKFLMLSIATVVLTVSLCKNKMNVTAQEKSIDTITEILEEGMITRPLLQYSPPTIYEKKVKNKKTFTGYTIGSVNVRKKPSLKSEVYEVYGFNKKVVYEKYNDDWVMVLKYSNGDKVVPAFMSVKYITDNPYKYVKYSVQKNGGFKSYMPYTSITSVTSPQYKLQKLYAYTGNCGIRQVKGRYCVAIGTAFNAKIGDYADLILNNGTVIPIIVSDIKADAHTDSSNIITRSNGCVSEFIVDNAALNKNIALHGNVSIANKKWNSSVVAIKVYDKNIFD